MSTHREDEAWMQVALGFAERARGLTMPNPAVGCVIVKDGQLLAAASTAPGGRPHAETEALRKAGGVARGATVYVTLEPCAHHGQTPPCANALVEAGIARVVIGVSDPNPEVNGKGIQILRDAGIEVNTGVLESRARSQHEGFFSRIQRQRPFVTLKAATSEDGFMASATPGERWLTNERSRNAGHLLRSKHEAILTGIGTVLADDPRLTCRLPGLENTSPLRIVIDRQLRIPPEAKILDTSAAPVWIATTAHALHEEAEKAATLQQSQVRLIEIGEPFLPGLLNMLGREGVNTVLVEAGPSLLSAFIKQHLADRLYWFVAPKPLATNGLAPFAQEIPVREQLSLWENEDSWRLGGDRCEIFRHPEAQ